MGKLLITALLILSSYCVKASIVDSIPVHTTTGTVTMLREKENNHWKYTIHWTASTTQSLTGVVKANLTDTFIGFIEKVTYNPTGSPTTGYDVTIKDDQGIDILQGTGANLTTSASSIVPLLSTYGHVYLFDTLFLQIDNAGNAKSGDIVIYMYRW